MVEATINPVPITLGSATLHHGDAVDVLRSRITTASIDMVYCDPPFGNQQDWRGTRGRFSDRWSWSAASDQGWAALRQQDAIGADLMTSVAPRGPGRAYLGVMAAILLELRRVLKATGTLWLHFDDTMGARLRILCDVVFGTEMALGTLIWRRTAGAHSNTKSFGRVHDTVACYGRSRAAFWRLWRLGTVGGDPCSPDWTPRFDDFVRTAPMNASDSERVGYPTQKPVALLEELIRAATLLSGTVLDPTCGSGTTLVAASRTGRVSIGIDASADAIACSRERLEPRPSAQPDLFGFTS